MYLMGCCLSGVLGIYSLEERRGKNLQKHSVSFLSFWPIFQVSNVVNQRAEYSIRENCLEIIKKD